MCITKLTHARHALNSAVAIYYVRALDKVGHGHGHVRRVRMRRGMHERHNTLYARKDVLINVIDSFNLSVRDLPVLHVLTVLYVPVSLLSP